MAVAAVASLLIGNAGLVRARGLNPLPPVIIGNDPAPSSKVGPFEYPVSTPTPTPTVSEYPGVTPPPAYN
jgi:hypothetical protein